MRKRIITSLLLIVALLAAASMFVPWKIWLGGALTRMLARQGIAPLTLTVDRIGLHGAVLREVTVGEENPITLRSLTLAFTPRELWEGRLRTLDLNKLALTAWREEGKLYFSGLGEVGKNQSAGPSPWLPPGKEALAQVPFTSVSIGDSEFNYLDNGMRVKIPWSAALSLVSEPVISVVSPGREVTGVGCPVSSGKITVAGKFDEKGEKPGWSGKFVMTNFSASCLKNQADSFSINGDWEATKAALTADFTATQARYETRTSWRFRFPFGGGKMSLTLLQGELSWNGGKISTQGVAVPLDAKSPVTAVVSLSALPLQPLMETLAKDKVSATGTVSGTLPITYRPGGGIEIGTGSLSTQEAGVLVLGAGVIPDNGNEQVALVRQLLQNFHYRKLELSTMESAGKPGLRLRVEGANPDVLQGHEINLNVNLTGDVVSLVQDSIRAFDSPKDFLKEKQHEPEKR